MDRQYLESFGLEKEQIDQILNKASNELGNKINEYENKIESLQQKYDSLSNELETANSTIDTLKKSNKDNEVLQKQIEQYKSDIEAVKQKAESDRVDMTIKMALNNAGAINPLTVMPLINKDAIVVGKDGTIAGIDEQVQAIIGNEENKYLFKQTENTVSIEPTRGGYEPTGSYSEPANPTLGGTELNIGKMLGIQNRQLKESMPTQKSVSDFWSSKNVNNIE